MSIRFKCRCGKILKANDASAGKHVTCPACKQPVRIPQPQPVSGATLEADLPMESLSEADVVSDPLALEEWDASPASSAPPLPRQPLPQYGKRRLSWKIPTIAITLVAACAVLGWIGYRVISNVLSPGTGEIEENFVPMLANQQGSDVFNNAVATAVASDPAVKVGDRFADYARMRDVPSAIGMIDQDLFHQRQMGPKGCYLSQRYGLTAKEVLNEASKYALESTTTHGGKRLWQTIGKSQYDGLPGVMLRYYSEPRAPFEIFNDKEVFEPVASMLSFDEFEIVAPDLYSFPEYKPLRKGGHSRYRSEISRDQAVSWNAGLLPPRTGYVLLLLDGNGDDAKVCDLVNVLGQQPLSRSCGPMFELGWTMMRPSGKAQPGLEKLIGSPFGDKPQKLVSYIVSEKPPPGYWLLPNGRHRVRAVRLEQISRAAAGPTFEIRVGEDNSPVQADLRTLVEQFREDFPGDLGADMAVVIIAMMPNEPRFYSSNTDQVMESATRLHERLADPFLLFVLGLAADSQGNLEVAHQHFTAALEAGFEAVDLHEFFIKQAIRDEDKEALKTAIARLNDYWNTADRPRNDQLQQKFANRWQAYQEAQKPPPPTLADHMKSNAGRGRPPFLGRGPGNPASGRPGPRRGPFGPPERRPPSQPNSSRPPGRLPSMTGWVSIEITFTSRFDGQATLRRLKEQLGVKNHSMNQSGKLATIRLGYDGPLDDVVELIDFGRVSAVDQDKRSITVLVD